MASIIQSYNYTIDIYYILDNKESEIMVESIQSLTTKYDYETKTMPILYLTLRLSTDLYNLMASNADKGEIVLTMYKSIQKHGIINRKTIYVRESFSYMMPSDLDYNRRMEKEIMPDSNSYRNCTIGLYSMKSINNNTKFINTIVKDSDMISIVHNYTQHMNMLIEPFKDNEKLPICIIPPMNTITKLLEFLNSYHNFYNSGYRYFRDFDKTYLLSTRGNPIKSSDEDFDTIIIRVMDPTVIETKKLSFEVNRTQRTYILYIDATFTNIHIDKLKDKKYNSVMTIDTMGNIRQKELNIPKNINSIERLNIDRVYNDNVNYIDTLSDNMQNTSVILNITKTEIDSALLTPNKEYLVQNFSSYKEYDGRYLLAYKREIIIQQDTRFISNTIFGLRKVM